MGNSSFTIESFDIEASGGIVCGLVALSGEVLGALLESQIDELTGDLFGFLALDLGNVFVCPAQP